MKESNKNFEDEYKLFDQKNSVLPKWLLNNGISCITWNIYESKDYLKRRLKVAEKKIIV